MPWIDFLGYAAALTVVAAFCMRTILPLRILAIASNVLFGMYGLFDHLYAVLVLHAVLSRSTFTAAPHPSPSPRLPRVASRRCFSIGQYLPLLRQRRLPAGATLFRGRCRRQPLLRRARRIGCRRDRRRVSFRRLDRRNRRLRARSSAHGNDHMPDGLRALRTERAQGEGALFPGPRIRLRPAQAYRHALRIKCPIICVAVIASTKGGGQRFACRHLAWRGKGGQRRHGKAMRQRSAVADRRRLPHSALDQRAAVIRRRRRFWDVPEAAVTVLTWCHR